MIKDLHQFTIFNHSDWKSALYYNNVYKEISRDISDEILLLLNKVIDNDNSQTTDKIYQNSKIPRSI